MSTKRPKTVLCWQSDNQLVTIVDEEKGRSLYFGENVLQSRLSMAAPHRLELSYTQYMMSVLLLLPEPRKVLLIGVGAGSLIHFLHHHFPGCIVDAVDRSQEIISIAVDYFHMPDRPPIATHCSDGYEFLAAQRIPSSYDLILLDAFDDRGMSSSVYRGDFFRLCMNALTREGILSCNLWAGIPDELTRVKDEIRQHSASRIYLPVPNRGNIIGLAFNTPVPWEKINRPKPELRALSRHFEIDLATIAAIALRHNLGLSQRIGLHF
ncbi:MAG: hypothetical protein P4L42_07575 [Desulfocapsaceae bacterium]|nr:hypothetical protein [Desulfocapsaceae bacterium]